MNIYIELNNGAYLKVRLYWIAVCPVFSTLASSIDTQFSASFKSNLVSSSLLVLLTLVSYKIIKIIFYFLMTKAKNFMH